MSRFTKAIMESINYAESLKQRNENFIFIQEKLGKLNELKWLGNCKIKGPMVYPFLVRHETLRKKLIAKKVYVATYWPEILNAANKKNVEYYLTKYLLPLPIDQRYGMNDMKIMVKLIKDII